MSNKSFDAIWPQRVPQEGPSARVITLHASPQVVKSHYIYYILCYIILYYILYYIILFYIISYYHIILYYIYILYYVILYYIIYYIILFYIILNYIILYDAQSTYADMWNVVIILSPYADIEPLAVY